MAAGLFADFDYDADVDFTNFLILSANFGPATSPDNEPAGSRVVPEPSMHLAWLVTLLLVLVRRKQGGRFRSAVENVQT